MSRLPLLLLVMLVWGFEGGTLGQTDWRIGPFTLNNINLRLGATPNSGRTPLRVGAWNIQDFGQSKMGKPHVVDTIVKVMRRYDIIVILEVSDRYEQVPDLLLNKLNTGANDPFLQVTSDRVGRGRHKEQYVFYWKPHSVLYVASETYSDPNDQFEYDPFIAEFAWRVNMKFHQFGFVAIHTTPRDAVSEIDALADVYFDFRRSSGIDDVMILGDFNAGGRYVKTRDFANIRLWTDSTFTWLTSHQTGTSVGTYYPYDRIVVAGATLHSIILSRGHPFYFDTTYGLTKAETLQVSDHYPIETRLSSSHDARTPLFGCLSTCISITVYLYGRSR